MLRLLMMVLFVFLLERPMVEARAGDLKNGEWRMKAAWDWHLPMETEEEQQRVVAFAHELGFNALVVKNPTQAMVRYGKELGVKIISVLSPYSTDRFTARHPECLQRMLSE